MFGSILSNLNEHIQLKGAILKKAFLKKEKAMWFEMGIKGAIGKSTWF
ncbi:hypothetical protein [Neobacillus drentensis]|nr:hypothetical protein [Neobacillus drentensis]